MKAPRFKLDDLAPKYREQAERQINRDRSTDTAANLEQTVSDAPLAKKKTKSRDTFDCCRIHIHSIRKRLCDADGISAKSAIDGLVHAGLLVDDSPSYVKEVSYSQEKGKKEITIIRLTYEQTKHTEDS